MKGKKKQGLIRSVTYLESVTASRTVFRLRKLDGLKDDGGGDDDGAVTLPPG